MEGDDITKGSVDVIVTDGFTGNVALKTAEGTAKLITEYMRRTFKSSMLAGIGYLLARPALSKLRQRVDPRRYNGAVFLGLVFQLKVSPLRFVELVKRSIEIDESDFLLGGRGAG